MAVEDDEQQQQPMGKKTSIVDLPRDILGKIFLRIPPESILSLKDIGNYWDDITSDPFFIKKFYAHRQRVILCSVSKPDALISFPVNDVLCDSQPVNELQLDYTFDRLRGNIISIVGSCDGLLCIILDGLLRIWNPSLRRRPFTLPPSRFKHESRGFGKFIDGTPEDPFNHYKVFGMGSEGTEVYSFITRSWQLINGGTPGIPFGNCKFSNGCLYWLVKKGETEDEVKIVSVHVQNETYHEVLQPAYDEGGGQKYLTLGNMGDCLCVLCYYPEPRRADVWVSEFNGETYSWNKLASISDKPGFQSDPITRVPFFISNDGKVLVQFFLRMIVHDCKTCTSYDIQNFDGWLRDTYVESWVSPPLTWH